MPNKCLFFKRLPILTGIRCHPQAKGLIGDCSVNFRFLLKAFCCLATGKICVIAYQLYSFMLTQGLLRTGQKGVSEGFQYGEVEAFIC